MLKNAALVSPKYLGGETFVLVSCGEQVDVTVKIHVNELGSEYPRVLDALHASRVPREAPRAVVHEEERAREIVGYKNVQISVRVDVRRRPAVMKADNVCQSLGLGESIVGRQQGIGMRAGERLMVITVIQNEEVRFAIPVEVSREHFARVDTTGRFGPEEPGAAVKTAHPVVDVDLCGDGIHRPVERRVEDVRTTIAVKIGVGQGNDSGSVTICKRGMTNVHPTELE